MVANAAHARIASSYYSACGWRMRKSVFNFVRPYDHIERPLYKYCIIII